MMVSAKSVISIGHIAELPIPNSSFLIPNFHRDPITFSI